MTAPLVFLIFIETKINNLGSNCQKLIDEKVILFKKGFVVC